MQDKQAIKHTLAECASSAWWIGGVAFEQPKGV